MCPSSYENNHGITRREFVKSAAAGAAGFALLGLPSDRSEAVEKYPHWGEVVVIRDDSVTVGPKIDEKIVQSMLDEAIKVFTKGGGWPSLIPSYKTGETVAIKVNGQNPPSSTHWQVVKAVITGLVGMGVPPNHIIVWDAEGESLKYTTMSMLPFAFSGLRLTATDKLSDPFDRSKSIDILGNPTCLSRILTDAAHLINVPVLKNHFEAGVTFALKNHVGSGGENMKNRQKIFHHPPEPGNRFHQIFGRGKPIAESIALINTAPDIKNKTRLIVGDALFGVYLRGPAGEPEFAYNGLIIGTDPVATDHQARLIIENERRQNKIPIVPSLHIEQAIKLGLGAPIDEMKVIPVDRTKKG